MKSRLLIFYLSPTLLLTLRHSIWSIFFRLHFTIVILSFIQKKIVIVFYDVCSVFSICFSNIFWWSNQIELSSAYVVLHIEIRIDFHLLLENKIPLLFLNQIDPSIFQPPTIFMFVFLVHFYCLNQECFHSIFFWIEKWMDILIWCHSKL